METKKKVEAKQQAKDVADQKASAYVNSEKDFIDSLKNILVLKPKVLNKTAFLYKGEKDLQDLCKVLGKTPKIEFLQGQLVYSFGKKLPTLTNTPCLIIFDSFGEIQAMQFHDIESYLGNFEIVLNSEVKEQFYTKKLESKK